MNLTHRHKKIIKWTGKNPEFRLSLHWLTHSAWWCHRSLHLHMFIIHLQLILIHLRLSSDWCSTVCLHEGIVCNVLNVAVSGWTSCSTHCRCRYQWHHQSARTLISPDLSLNVLQRFYDYMKIKLSFIFEFGFIYVRNWLQTCS